MTREQIEREIRENIEGCVRAVRNDRSPQIECLFKAATNNILLLTQKVYYLKAERELPENPYTDYAEKGEDEFLELQRCRVYSKAQQDMLQPDTEGRVWASVYKWE